MTKWYCTRCGYIHEGDEPPQKCPVCGAPKELFVPYEQASAQNEGSSAAESAADILVVGSGGAAFAAAITAKAGGASVIMLEKAATVGGTTARSGAGMWIPNNRFQKEQGYVENREDCLRYMARYSYPHLYHPDSARYGIPQREYRLLEAFFDNASKMMEFMEREKAVEYINEINWAGKAPVDYQNDMPENKNIRGRTIYSRNPEGGMGPGSDLIRQLEQWAKANEIRIVTNCEVTEILRNREGRVVGLNGSLGGKEAAFRARKGVIFGSGGYSHNPEYMLQFQRGPHFGGCSVPTNTGDFIRMAGRVGARMGNTAGAFRAQSIVEAYLANPDGSSNVFYIPGDSVIMVNKYGKRVMNEKRNYTDRGMVHFVWDPNKAEWTNMLLFMIYDQHTASLWQGYPPYPVLGGDSPEYLIKANTLHALTEEICKHLERIARYTGEFFLDEEFLPNLQSTVEHYNQYARSGDDLEWNRGESAYDREWTTFPPTAPQGEWPSRDMPNYTMYPMDGEGPFYAVILGAGTLDTNGGPVIDENARVLDWDNQPVEGLYGAGNCIASPTANAYWGAGSTIGPGMTFGYIAARHALELPPVE